MCDRLTFYFGFYIGFTSDGGASIMGGVGEITHELRSLRFCVLMRSLSGCIAVVISAFNGRFSIIIKF